MTKIKTALVLLALMATPALADFNAYVSTGGSLFPDNPYLLTGDRVVSAVNTQIQKTYDIHNAALILDIHGACSAGTAALTVAGSSDGTNFLTLDSITAAATQIKHYNNTTVGAGIALTPLAFRYVQITLATCGGGNTGTLTVAAK